MGLSLGDDLELGPNQLYLESPVELVREPDDRVLNAASEAGEAPELPQP